MRIEELHLDGIEEEAFLIGEDGSLVDAGSAFGNKKPGFMNNKVC